MAVMTQTEPSITPLPERHYVALAASVTMPTLGTVVPPLLAEVFGWLGGRGTAPAGPPFFRYNVIDMAGRIEIEAGVPVAVAATGEDRVLAGVLPAGRYVTVSHIGAPDTLAAATADLLHWAAARGLTWDMAPSPAGERWGARLESYLSDPASEPDPARWVTELAFRLAG